MVTISLMLSVKIIDDLIRFIKLMLKTRFYIFWKTIIIAILLSCFPWQSLFEQFFAAEDYGIFVRLMVQKNIELQQQALAMIMQMQGALPESLKDGKSEPTSPPPAAPTPKEQYGAQNEDAILKAVLE